MDLLEDMLTHKVCYWAPKRASHSGQQLFEVVVELNARWEDRNEMFLDKMGNQQISRSRVYLNEDVEVLGVLWLSSKLASDPDGSAISELTNAFEPFENEGAFEIRKFDKIPDIDGEEYVRRALL